jgi:hypothetical protein
MEETNKNGDPRPAEFEQFISANRFFVVFVRDYKNFNAVVVVLTLVIAIATLGQGVASLLQWSAMHDQLGQMIEQSGTMQRQMEIADRPWLKVEIAVVSGFEFTKEGGAAVTIQPRITNIGHSVATDITFAAEMILPAMDNQNQYFRALRKRQKELCDQMDSGVSPGPDIARRVIFPADSDQSLSQSLGVSRSDIEKVKGVDGSLHPFIVGCVDYQFATAIRGHRTPFVYILSHHDRTLQFPFRAIRVGHPLSAPDVEIYKWPFGGFDAY